jgi:hypothetical protein
MKREELLGWIGIAIGLPGFVVLFGTGKWAIAVLVALIVGLLIWHKWVVSRPDFSVLDIEKTYVIQDRAAHRTILRRSQRMKANHKGLTEFWFTNISADGGIENILIDGKAPAEERLEAGDLRVCRRWDRPLRRGDEIGIDFSYDLVDAFPSNPEGVIHVAAYKAKRLKLVVQFHKERPCTSVRAFLRYGGQIYRDLPTPRVSEDRSRAELEIHRLKIGREVELQWTWDQEPGRA